MLNSRKSPLGCPHRVPCCDGIDLDMNFTLILLLLCLAQREANVIKQQQMKIQKTDQFYGEFIRYVMVIPIYGLLIWGCLAI